MKEITANDVIDYLAGVIESAERRGELEAARSNDPAIARLFRETEASAVRVAMGIPTFDEADSYMLDLVRQANGNRNVTPIPPDPAVDRVSPSKNSPRPPRREVFESTFVMQCKGPNSGDQFGVNDDGIWVSMPADDSGTISFPNGTAIVEYPLRSPDPVYRLMIVDFIPSTQRWSGRVSLERLSPTEGPSDVVARQFAIYPITNDYLENFGEELTQGRSSSKAKERLSEIRNEITRLLQQSETIIYSARANNLKHLREELMRRFGEDS